MREYVKVIKKIFFGLVFLLLLGCAGILICAFNPSLTAKLAQKVNGMGAQTDNVQDDRPSDGQSGGPAGVADSANGQGAGGIQSGINTDWMNGRGGESYEKPSVKPVGPPETVGSRMGYTPVKGDAEQIPDEEADNLSNILAQGDTGSGLTFDPEYYPYYAMLEPQLQRLYNQIYANAVNFTASFSPVVSASTDQIRNVFEAVFNDHPELFWMDTGYSCKYLRSGTCVEISLKYNETLNDIQAAKKAFTEAAEAILAGARAQSSDLEKERYVHDALMQTVDYNMRARMSQSAFSALVNGESVCAGYARAFQYLLQQLGIPCYYCTGTAGEDHAWNIVKMGSLYRNVDVTWDDTEPSTYDYYNKSDREFGSTHVRTDLAVYLPACAEVSAVQTEEPGSSAVDAYINPNPIEPLVWQSRGDPYDKADETKSEEEKRKENLEKAGITEDQVLETLEKYYEDCKKRLEDAGTGEKQFVNIISESLWSSVEGAYSSGTYMTGYVNDALKKLGVDNFLIQLQVQRLGGGYCKLYHNVYTY